MSAIHEAEKLVRAAESELAAIDRHIRERKEAAAAAIAQEFQVQRSAALEAVKAARRSLTAAQDATPDHPWHGQRVYRMQSQGRSWERRPEVRVEGVVETVRSTTDLPANTASYRRPPIGQAIVRLLKSDGSPGRKFEALERGSWRPWKLADAPSGVTATGRAADPGGQND